MGLKTVQLNCRRTIHGSNAVIAVSNFTNSQIHRLCQSKPTNTHLIPNGTDIEYFKPIDKNQEGNLREKYNIKKTSLILLTLARVIPRKGHDVVIKALPQIVKVIPNIIYLIAGPENLKWKIELTKIASELRVENHIRFLGYVTDQEKLDLYQICDTYIMVSKNADLDGDSEGFGITFLEANACGKPVIGSNTDGIPDAVENSVSGLLVEPNNVDQTVEAIIKLLSNHKLRTKMGELARKRVENHFTWDHVVTEIRDLIDNRAFIL
ncbi:MAG: glycosyltransferase family 4 protein [Candidatus Marinimicrobia bacterium]|nr:glycosyltransferase family 4 protein [Candidatus Neomarinimicrobiota bacterium]